MCEIKSGDGLEGRCVDSNYSINQLHPSVINELVILTFDYGDVIEPQMDSSSELGTGAHAWAPLGTLEPLL
jgi:hypothetical protein